MYTYIQRVWVCKQDDDHHKMHSTTVKESSIPASRSLSTPRLLSPMPVQQHSLDLALALHFAMKMLLLALLTVILAQSVETVFVKEMKMLLLALKTVIQPVHH